MKTLQKQIWHKLKEETIRVLYVGGSFVRNWKGHTLERVRHTWNDFKYVLEKDGEGQLRNEQVLHRAKEVREILHIVLTGSVTYCVDIVM
jgi:hypothetical protein